MSASVREESGIFVDFHFSEGGDFEFCSTFLRFQKVSARSAIEVVRVCAEGKFFHHHGTKTRRKGTKKAMGLVGNAGERELTAEIAEAMSSIGWWNGPLARSACTGETPVPPF